MEGEPSWWDEAYEAWWWLERFGLTTTEVGAMPAHIVARIPQIVADVDEYREEHMKRESRG